MKIATRELIIRLMAAGIGFALTGAVFRIAVAQSQEVAIVTAGNASGSYENSDRDERAELDGTAITELVSGSHARIDPDHRLTRHTGQACWSCKKLGIPWGSRQGPGHLHCRPSQRQTI